MKEPTRTRSNFAETWLWKDISVGYLWILLVKYFHSVGDSKHFFFSLTSLCLLSKFPVYCLLPVMRYFHLVSLDISKMFLTFLLDYVAGIVTRLVVFMAIVVTCLLFCMIGYCDLFPCLYGRDCDNERNIKRRLYSCPNILTSVPSIFSQFFVSFF